jgi:hypothetical protein
VLALASVAMAGFSFTNPGPIDSNGPAGDPVNGVVTYNYAGADFAPGYFIFSGNLTEVNTATYASEARCQIINPFGSVYTMTAGFTNITSFTGTIAIGPALVGPLGLAGTSVGNWTFRFFESFDDGGDLLRDAYWTDMNFQITNQFQTIYSFDMSSDPGWTMDPAANPNNPGWAFGTPTGTNDPHDRQCYGYNNTTTNSGNYPNSMTATEWLTSTALNFSGYSTVLLQFDRYLGVESSTYDHAYVDVSNDGGATWTHVFENPATTTNDSAWTTVTYDITGIAANQANVKVRWGLGATDSSVNYRGWNIDNVLFTGVPEPASLLLLGIAVLSLRRR